MSTLDIVKLPADILRKKTKPVTKFDAELQTLIDDMIETLAVSNGVGLAAPQVDVPLQLAIISPPPEEDEDGNEIPDSRPLFVIANPEIVWQSRELVDGIEGCLSIPGYVGEVTRHQSIRVRAQDRHGKKIKLKLTDWTARIFQHEIDHLNGVLYLDRLSEPSHMWTDEEFDQLQEKARKRRKAKAESAEETS